MPVGAHAVEAAGAGRTFEVVSTELPADLETPVSAYLKLRAVGAGFLFESAEGVDKLGRYSFIGFGSGRSLRCRGTKTVYTDEHGPHVSRGDPLNCRRAVLTRTQLPSCPDVQRLEDLGADAVLMGEAIVTAPEPERMIRFLLGRRR